MCYSYLFFCFYFCASTTKVYRYKDIKEISAEIIAKKIEILNEKTKLEEEEKTVNQNIRDLKRSMYKLEIIELQDQKTYILHEIKLADQLAEITKTELILLDKQITNYETLEKNIDQNGKVFDNKNAKNEKKLRKTREVKSEIKALSYKNLKNRFTRMNEVMSLIEKIKCEINKSNEKLVVITKKLEIISETQNELDNIYKKYASLIEKNYD